MRLLNLSELSHVLQTNTTALSELVSRGMIPYTKVPTKDGYVIRFIPQRIRAWAKKDPIFNMDDKKYLERLRNNLKKESPHTIKKIKEFSKHYSEPVEPKGYYLTKIDNKKIGFVFYVRYIKDGKLIPSRWCTHTNDRKAAERFAEENREKILKKYFERDIIKKPCSELYFTLKNYYKKNSPFLEIDIKRGRVLNDTARETYHGFILKQFIPYLRKQKIKEFREIDAPFLARFQNYLLADKNIKGKIINGLKSQTINNYIGWISQIFDHLIITGDLISNPCNTLALKVPCKDQKATGCYDINKLKGVFNKKWNDEYSYLLNMLIYTTDMRNIEIENMQVKDIIKIENINFIDIPESKTANGVRIVPLHLFVYKKLIQYIKKSKLENDDYILKKNKTIGSHSFKKAYLDLAEYTGYTVEQLEKENIKFYSGRHFWKTLMNSENLGDVEEYFMGHKVSSDIAKRYNHRDKQGRDKLTEKAKKVFQVLDQYIFIKR